MSVSQCDSYMTFLAITKRRSGSYLQGFKHRGGEHVRVVLAGEVEAVHLLVVPPLVESGRGLVVFQPLENGAVDHHL